MLRTLMRTQLRMIRVATLAIGVAALLIPVTAASASGGSHTQSVTENFHGQFTEVSENPCTGDPIELQESGNGVMHTTWFTASDEVWSTFTQTARFSGIDEGNEVSYTGHATVWGGFNLNRQNETSSFTETIHAFGSDGSSISFHDVAHFTLTPGGKVAVEFEHPSLTCTAAPEG